MDLSTKSSHVGSSTPSRPVHLPGIRPVVASEVGGTTPASECLGSGTGVPECVRVEEIMGSSKVTRGFVPGGYKELWSASASPFWEGEGGLYGDSS